MEVTLYKKNSKGKVLVWHIKPMTSYGKVELQTSTGEYFGGKVLHFKKVVGKNIGKSNETTPTEQAELMIVSLALGQRKYGYRSVDDLQLDEMTLAMGTEQEFVDLLQKHLPNEAMDLDNMLKPMLASQYYRTNKGPKVNKEHIGWTDPTGKVWKDRKYYYLRNPNVVKEKGAVVAKFPMFGQPKINGVRCSVYLEEGEVRMKSKNGEVYYVDHIVNWFMTRPDLFTDLNGDAVIYDGELYIHNESLQNIRSAVSKPNLSTHAVTYEVYDLAIPKHSNRVRIAMMKELLQETVCQVTNKPYENSPVRYITTYKVINDAHVQSLTDRLIAEGYEGLILRNPDAVYQFGKRTVNMLKLKRLIDEEFRIIGIVPQENDSELGMYLCVTPNGEEFKVTPTEDEDYKRMMILMPHLFLNKMLTCTFYEYTDKEIPFHINHTIVRDYENNDPNKSF